MIGTDVDNTADLGGNIVAENIGTTIGEDVGEVVIWGNLADNGDLSTDLDGDENFDEGEGAIGNITINGNLSGEIKGISGIGNVKVTGNIDYNDGEEVFLTDSKPGSFANIGTKEIRSARESNSLPKGLSLPPMRATRPSNRSKTQASKMKKSA